MVDNYAFARPLLRYLEIFQLEENKVVCLEMLHKGLLTKRQLHISLLWDIRLRLLKEKISREPSHLKSGFFVELKH